MSINTLLTRGILVSLLEAAETDETGTAKSKIFTLATAPSSNGSVKFQVHATDPDDEPVTITALVVDLESRLDPDGAWAEQTGLDFSALEVTTIGLQQGGQYRLNVTSITVDNPVDIKAVLG